MNFGLDGLLARKNIKQFCKEDCFCAVAIYTDMEEEISSVLWKTQQKSCRQAQISLPGSLLGHYFLGSSVFFNLFLGIAIAVGAVF